MRIKNSGLLLIAGITLSMTLLGSTVSARICPPDSIGTVVIEGKTYVLHQVDPGETLFSLARRYHVSVTEIQATNSMNGSGLNVGQKLRIPRANAPATSTSSDGFVENHPSNNDKIHIVMPGQTLFGVARHYKISVADVKRINKLNSDGIKVGQMLWIVDKNAATSNRVESGSNEPDTPPDTPEWNTERSSADPESEDKPVTESESADNNTHTVAPGETLYSIARQHDMSVTELKKLNRLESGAISVGQKLKISNAPAGGVANSGTSENRQGGSSTAQSGSSVIEESPTVKSDWVIPAEAKKELYKDKSTGKNYYRVTETGTADALLSGVDAQAKFYAKHKFLPKGSVVFVECPPTGQTVLLKIEERLPASDDNIIRLSKKAMEYLLMDGQKQVVLKYSLPAE